jgi:hypothetical protein
MSSRSPPCRALVDTLLFHVESGNGVALGAQIVERAERRRPPLGTFECCVMRSGKTVTSECRAPVRVVPRPRNCATRPRLSAPTSRARALSLHGRRQGPAGLATAVARGRADADAGVFSRSEPRPAPSGSARKPRGRSRVANRSKTANSSRTAAPSPRPSRPTPATRWRPSPWLPPRRGYPPSATASSARQSCAPPEPSPKISDRTPEINRAIIRLTLAHSHRVDLPCAGA